MRYFYLSTICILASLVQSGCFDKMALAEMSFGKATERSSKASPASVISMGRDDDDGKAKKWHIGGGED